LIYYMDNRYNRNIYYHLYRKSINLKIYIFGRHAVLPQPDPPYRSVRLSHSLTEGKDAALDLGTDFLDWG
jgi:hypothetical protein